MTLGTAFDILLCLLVLAVAFGAILGRDLFTGVALYVVYGLLLAIAWVRLEAIDVALAEAAIGAGLTGLLLLAAVARLEGRAPHRLDLRPAALALALLVAAGLVAALARLARPDAGLTGLAAAPMEDLGLGNPVTAVLLAYRGWDTLLEAVVLLVALVGIWSLGPDALWHGRPGLRQHVRKDGVLATFGRFLPPLGIMVGVYLVWIGAYAPGGAFQAGTVLAAVWLLAMMAGLAEPPRIGGPGLRWALAGGPLLFLAIGGLGLLWGAFMAYPPGGAKTAILAIEFALTASIALTLALLVLGPARSAR
jgi:multisubunit Na+/H+ antiporter MnhB subunit